jgi:hypothetical protein
MIEVRQVHPPSYEYFSMWHYFHPMNTNSIREGWIKLKCDGAYKDSLGLAGCGGLIWKSDDR